MACPGGARGVDPTDRASCWVPRPSVFHFSGQGEAVLARHSVSFCLNDVPFVKPDPAHWALRLAFSAATLFSRASLLIHPSPLRSSLENPPLAARGPGIGKYHFSGTGDQLLVLQQGLRGGTRTIIAGAVRSEVHHRWTSIPLRVRRALFALEVSVATIYLQIAVDLFVAATLEVPTDFGAISFDHE